MKRAIAIGTAAVLCLSLLSGCFGGGPEESQLPSDTVESVQPSQAPAGGPSQEPSQEVSQEPVQTPSQEPAQGEGVDLAAFAQTVQENHEFHSLERVDPSDPDLGAIMLENTYPGLKDMDLEQTEVYLAAISFSGGELALVQAKNAEDAAKVKEIFQARIDQKSVDDIGNYPEEVEMWKNHGRLAASGNYVMLVNHEDSETIVSEFEALFK